MNLKKKLLVVDQSDSTKIILDHFLGKEFDIIQKSNGYEAIDFLNSGIDIDFLITELNLPLLSGKELIKKLRESHLFSSLPILLLTASSESKDRIECMNLGADNFIEKPFNPFEIQARINAVLRLCRRTNYIQ
ncbi:PleD family two-component system response regulator [Flectobacillus sp. BAB-3569]|uniref:response regulator n=1 Tax=Flectobacillus sp. BAB-3569 TaxID=1509483 RepID=UPI000BCF49AC|nr:response regulator [Flectobacillus sp. BAB-3569]NBA75017.1 response regulator [Emticicia sp. ODNR4P]PAC26591.1 two-component system response regulator [Flectobacillus sp. BAB-3569]